MPDLPPGSTIKALDTTPTQMNFQTTTVTTTSTTYVTSGADCAVVFTAPTTGRVKIYVTARLVNSNVNGSFITPETREGATIGSGTVVEAAADANSNTSYGTGFARQTAMHLLTGLVPGAVYNTRLLMKCSVTTETASFANRELTVEPAT